LAEIVVRTENLWKTYMLGEVEVHALNDVNLEVNRGEMVSLVGPSGSGKTTLLNMIGGIGRASKGRVVVDDEDITANFDDSYLIRRQKIGFIFQFFNLIPALTARENVQLPMELIGKPDKERRDRAAELLTHVGLEDRMNHRPGELSGGEQQRVAIARALANSPSIILADEPTGNLDTKTGKSIVGLMKELNQAENQTFIITTHDRQLARLSNRVIYLRDGKVENIEEISDEVRNQALAEFDRTKSAG
jgi:putative ABC transport system ATP-binding protein